MALFVPEVFVFNPAFAAFDIRDLHDGFRLPLSTATSDKLLIACNKVIKADFSLRLQACHLIECVLNPNLATPPRSPTNGSRTDLVQPVPRGPFPPSPASTEVMIYDDEAFVPRPPSPAPSESSCCAVVDFPTWSMNKALPPLPTELPLTPPSTPPRAVEHLSDAEVLARLAATKPSAARPLPRVPAQVVPVSDPRASMSCCTPEWAAGPASYAPSTLSSSEAYDGVTFANSDSNSDCASDCASAVSPTAGLAPAERVAKFYKDVRALRANHPAHAEAIIERIRFLRRLNHASAEADFLISSLEA